MKDFPSLAIWPDKFLDPLVKELQKTTSGFNVVVTERERCEQLVLAGMVDVALVSAIPVFLHEDDLDVYSASAVSSWKFPFATIQSNSNLGDPITRVEYKPEDRWYAVIAKVVLNEHYQQSPSFVESESPSIDQPESAMIVVEDKPGKHATSGMALDLGQEWFELTGYPMVWGLFACSKGTLLQRTNDALRDATAIFKARNDSNGNEPLDESLEEFYSENIRVGYDDLVTASLTELSQFLFFYNVVDQPVTVPVIASDTDD